MSLDRITEWQRTAYRKAKQDRRHRFGDLHSLFSRPDWLDPVMESVLSRQRANVPGVDGKTAAAYATPDKQRELMEIAWGALRGDLYVPMALRRAHIPKAHGSGTRAIYVATIQDRVIGQALKMGLEPIFEADFADCSVGFRPHRRVMDSIYRLSNWINADHLWILLADVKNCFPNIIRERLIELMEKRIADRQVLDLIHAFLDAGALDRGVFVEADEGIAQGFLLAPLLANIYLDQIDKWWAKHFHPRLASQKPFGRPVSCWYCRYADNLVFVCNALSPDALRVQEELQSFAETTLGFDLSHNEIVNATAGFQHLGFHLLWIEPRRTRRRLQVQASEERIERFKRSIAETINAPTDPVAAIPCMNQLISSFGSEFRYVDSRRQFQELDRWIESRLDQVMTKVDITMLKRGGLLNVRNHLLGLKKLVNMRRERYRPTSGCPF